MIRRKVFIVVVLMCLVLGLSACQMGQLQDDSGLVSILTEEEESTKEIQEIYDEQMDRAEENADEVGEEFLEKKEQEFQTILDSVLDGTEESDKSLPEQLLLWFYQYYTVIRMWAAPICFVLMILGVIIYKVAQDSKSVQKFALYGLTFGSFILYVLLVFGIGWLNDIFLY